MSKTFFVTFGCGGALRDRIVGIVADDEMTARQAICSVFGTKWAFIYRAKRNSELIRQRQEFNYSFLFCLNARKVSEHNEPIVALSDEDNFYAAYNLEDEDEQEQKSTPHQPA